MSEQPVYTCSSGIHTWLFNGRLHREDGPAIMYENGNELWYLNGVHHRIGGPAIDTNLGQVWCVHGKLHRTDGPAVICMDGTIEWWLNDDIISSSEDFQKIAGLSDEAMNVLILQYGEIK